MGIFDFLFGKSKKKQDSPSPSPKRERQDQTTEQASKKIPFLNRVISVNANPEWKKELDKMLELEANQKHPIYNLRKDNRARKPLISFMLEGHSIGSKTTLPQKKYAQPSSSNIGYQQAIYDLISLGTKYNKTDSHHFQLAISGLVIAITHNLEASSKDAKHKIQHLLNVLINNNLTYQASMLIEEIESKRIVGKQLAYFQILIKNTTKSPEINEEIMNQLVENKYSTSHPDVLLFQDRSVLNQFIQFEKYVSSISRTLNVPTLITERLNEEAKRTPDLSQFLKLFLFNQKEKYGKAENDKLILKFLLDKVDINYYLLQDMMHLFAENTSGIGIFNSSVILKVAKKYFASEPLDSDSYTLLKKCMVAADTIARSKAINQFLFHKADHLYNIHDPEYHRLIHSGIMHSSDIEHHYYGAKSAATKYLYDVVTLLSQIATVVVQKEDPQTSENIISINGASVSVRPKGIIAINKELANQKIPYQLIDHYHHTDPAKQKRSKLISTLLVNEEESALLQAKNYSNRDTTRNKKLISNLVFAQATSPATPINNDIKEVSKQVKSEISTNKFIHDIKWRDVKVQLIDQLTNRREWYEMMHILLSYSGTVEPSENWQEKLKTQKEKFTATEFADGLSQLTQDVLQNEFWFNKENVKALRGVIWANSLLDNETACKSLKEVLNYCYLKIPMVGPKSVSGGSTAMAALISMDTAESYNVLVSLKEGTNYDRFQKQLDLSLKQYESKSKTTVANLKEHAVSTYGFVKGSKILLIDDVHYIKWTIKDRKVKSQWIDKEGNKLKKAPSISDIQKRANRSTTKILNDAITQFDNRMNAYKMSDISWTAKDWHKNYLKHEFIQLIIDNYLWVIHQEDGTELIVVTQNGRAIDINDQWYILGETDQVKPYHSSEVSQEANTQWINYFNEKKIIPFIDYFYRSNFTIEEGLSAMQTLSSWSGSIYTSRDWQYDNLRTLERNTKELPFIDKVVMAERPTKRTEDEKVITTLSYHNSIPKKRNNKIDSKKLGPAIDPSQISKKIQIECINEFLDGLLQRGLNNASFQEHAFDVYMTIPQLKIIHQLCTKIDESNLFENYSYKDLEISIVGKLHTYRIPIIKMYIEIEKRDKNKTYRLYNLGAPKKNYPLLLGMPMIPNELTNNLLAAIESLTDESNVKIKYFKNWLEKK